MLFEIAKHYNWLKTKDAAVDLIGNSKKRLQMVILNVKTF